MRIEISGRVRVEVYERGRLVDRQHIRNVITSAGRTHLADLVRGEGGRVGFLAVGTGDRAPAVADTALEAEVYRDGITSMSAAAAELTVSHFLPAQAAVGSTLAEMGLWTAATGGILFARALLDRTIAKTDQITATLTWIIAFGSS